MSALTNNDLDLPDSNPCGGNLRRSVNTVAVQFPLLSGDALHDERVGQLCFHILCYP